MDAEVVAPLKYIINFCRSLDLLLINCEIELDLSWWKCTVSEMTRIPTVPGNARANPPIPNVKVIQTTSATFLANNAKLYVSVVTLSIKW